MIAWYFHDYITYYSLHHFLFIFLSKSSQHSFCLTFILEILLNQHSKQVSFYFLNISFSAHLFLLLVYFFVQYHWEAYFNSCQDFCLFFWSSFSAQLSLLFIYFLFNIIEKLILTHVKTLVYFSDNIMKFSSQHV